ncbi:hypothetical protein [Krasilnikovia sp. MM14-A1259]|uniref:hypothetical protein n=1 Tax=Krasilnikovia sp. MM14-A1259 TaxID=3373539 RepID=UPI00380DAC0F
MLGSRRRGDLAGMDRDAAAAAWTTLIEWVRDVLTGVCGAVGDTGRHPCIPSCWRRHPHAVAELGWLCQEWYRLYGTGTGTPAGAGEWHNRWLPGVIRRLAKEATTAKCGLHHEPTRHRPDDFADDAAALGKAVRDDVDRRRAAPPAAGARG